MPTPPDWVLAQRRRLGDRIREARKAAKLTQESVALECDIGRQTLNRIEQGHAAARVDTVFLIADAIGVDPGDLMRRR